MKLTHLQTVSTKRDFTAAQHSTTKSTKAMFLFCVFLDWVKVILWIQGEINRVHEIQSF